MAISDFVLLHNKAAEGLAKHDHVGYDIYSGIADTKALFLKYCKPYEKRAFAQWNRRIALFQPGMEKIRQPSPFRDTWLVQRQKAKKHSPL
jgi:hypothetical protein